MSWLAPSGVIGWLGNRHRPGRAGTRHAILVRWKMKFRQPGYVRGTWLIAIPIALIVVVAFAPALNNGFVNWDDKKQLPR